MQAWPGGPSGHAGKAGRTVAIFAASLPSDQEDKLTGVFPRKQNWQNRMKSNSWSYF